MKEIDRITSKIKEKLSEYKVKYDVEEMGIFGSFIREEENQDSDLDILVQFKKPNHMTLFKYWALENELSELTGKDVELVNKSTLKKRIGQNILKEVVYL